MKKILYLTTVILITASIIRADYYPQDSLPAIVTIEDINRFPERYENKLISIAGYCSLGFEQTAIYDTKEHLKFQRTEYGVWLSLKQTDYRIYNSTGNKLEGTFNFEGLPVIIEGIYNAASKGHFSQYSGSVCIRRVTLFNDEKELHSRAAENLVVYVSNQSIGLNPVDISVKIDDKTAIADTFDVKGRRVIQHNQIKYKFRVPLGKHTILVKSNIGEAELERIISVTTPHFLNIEFHYSPEYTGDQKNKKFIRMLEDKEEFRFQ